MSRDAAIVSVVVVNWNGAEHLEECLSSLRGQTVAAATEVIVVDNGSSDPSGEILARVSDSVRTLRNMENVGFAAACNQGIRNCTSPFIALLNNDAVAEPRWLEELIAALRAQSNAGMATSKVLNYFDRSILDNTGHVVFADGLTRGRGRLEKDVGQFESVEEVFGLSGSAALLRREMLDDVGLFDEDFFAYCEDADLSMRARLRGWSCIYVPTAIAYHKFSAASDPYSRLKALNVERNRLWLAVKDFPLPLLLVSPFFTLHRYFWQAVGALIGRGASGRFAASASRSELILVLLRAWRMGLGRIPVVWRQRRQIQAGRRVTARELWRQLRRFGIGARAIAWME